MLDLVRLPSPASASFTSRFLLAATQLQSMPRADGRGVSPGAGARRRARVAGRASTTRREPAVFVPAIARFPSVLRLVDQLVLGDPRHHRAQLLADLLDRVLGVAL